MLGDVEAGRDPHAVMPGEVVEEADERRRATRPPDQPAVQAHRHHPRRAFAFRVEQVKGVAQVGEEVVALAEALRNDEAHVVGIERIRDQEVRAFRAR